MGARQPPPPPPRGYLPRADAAEALGMSIRKFERVIQPKLDPKEDTIHEATYPRRMFIRMAAANKILLDAADPDEGAPAAGPDKERYDKARADREEANAEKARLEVARLKGELLDAGLVETGLRSFATIFRNSGQLLQARFGSAAYEFWMGVLGEGEREIERVLAEAAKTPSTEPPKDGKPKRGPGRPRKAKAKP